MSLRKQLEAASNARLQDDTILRWEEVAERAVISSKPEVLIPASQLLAMITEILRNRATDQTVIESPSLAQLDLKHVPPVGPCLTHASRIRQQANRGFVPDVAFVRDGVEQNTGFVPDVAIERDVAISDMVDHRPPSERNRE